MEQVIDPEADALWGSVATTIDRRGTVEHRPKSEADWLELRRSALVLVEATRLLAEPGRHVAQQEHVLADASAPGKLTAVQIQTALEKQHDLLAALARGLQLSGLEALSAIDAHDVERLEVAGGNIDESCEARHNVFRYPPSVVPARP